MGVERGPRSLVVWDEQLGEGSHSIVLHGEIRDGKSIRPVAVKWLRTWFALHGEQFDEADTLSRIYTRAHRLQLPCPVPRVWGLAHVGACHQPTGWDAYNHAIEPVAFATRACDGIVLQKLGRSVGSLFDEHGPFTMRTTLEIGILMLNALQSLHRLGYLHGSVKPDNFCFGATKGARNTLFAVDLQRSVCLEPGRCSYEVRQGGQRGTTGALARRCANTPAQVLSMAGEVEAVAHALVMLRVGRLPWSGETPHQMFNMKGDMSLHSVVPFDPFYGGVLQRFLGEARRCTNSIAPDYDRLRQILRQQQQYCGITGGCNMRWDWDMTRHHRCLDDGGTRERERAVHACVSSMVRDVVKAVFL